MRVTPNRLRAMAALLGCGAFVGMVLLGDRSPTAILLSVVASIAAGATAILVVLRPLAAFGLLFVLASMSAIVVQLPIGRVRLEQPSIIAALTALAVTSRWPRRSEIRPILPIVALFTIYLVVLIVASILHAPEPLVSGRMIIWTTLSMVGGFAVFALLVRADNGHPETWLVGTGVLHSCVGLAIASAFLLFGPSGIPGMQTSPGEVPKVSALAFEANLFASTLGAIAPFTLNRFWTRPGITRAIPVLLVVIGTGLGVTRGAYAGLGAGLLVYLAILAYRSEKPARIAGMVPVIALSFLMAPLVSAVSLPAEPPGAHTPGQTSSPVPSVSPRSPRPTETPRRTPSPEAVPSPPPVDTFAYRMNRIPVALRELQTSPVIGLGAASYGQRHELPHDLAGTPDYIGILALVAVYESGLLGGAALALGFLLSIGLLFQLSRIRPGPAAAYVGSIVALLVAYQATNAMFFSTIWLILGAGLAMAARARSADVPHSSVQSHRT